MQNDDLFDNDDPGGRPLADRMRLPGSTVISARITCCWRGKPLRRAIESGRLHSMIFWGPPGTGKTTLARLLAGRFGLCLRDDVGGAGWRQDIRAAVDKARHARAQSGRGTVLFIDEVHRFNKSQQDAFCRTSRTARCCSSADHRKSIIVRAQQRVVVRARSACSSRCRQRAENAAAAALSDQKHGFGRTASRRSAMRHSTCWQMPPTAMPGARSTCWRSPPIWRSPVMIADAVIKEVAAAGAAFRQGWRSLLRPDLGTAQIGAWLVAGRCAVLAVPDARRWLRSVVRGAPRGAYGVRKTSATPTRAGWRLRSMPGRSRNVSAARRANWQSPGSCLSGLRTQEQRGLHRLQPGHGQRA